MAGGGASPSETVDIFIVEVNGMNGYELVCDETEALQALKGAYAMISQ